MEYTAKIIVAAHKPYTMPDDKMYGAEGWANEIEKLSSDIKRTDKNEIEKRFTEAGYNINTEIKRLEKLLMEKKK